MPLKDLLCTILSHSSSLHLANLILGDDGQLWVIDWGCPAGILRGLRQRVWPRFLRCVQRITLIHGRAGYRSWRGRMISLVGFRS